MAETYGRTILVHIDKANNAGIRKQILLRGNTVIEGKSGNCACLDLLEIYKKLGIAEDKWPVSEINGYHRKYSS